MSPLATAAPPARRPSGSIANGKQHGIEDEVGGGVRPGTNSFRRKRRQAGKGTHRCLLFGRPDGVRTTAAASAPAVVNLAERLAPGVMKAHPVDTAPRRTSEVFKPCNIFPVALVELSVCLSVCLFSETLDQTNGFVSRRACGPRKANAMLEGSTSSSVQRAFSVCDGLQRGGGKLRVVCSETLRELQLIV